jgi:hypothetical protein
VVRINGDTSLPQPPAWGSGSFEVQERASLGLTYVALLRGVITVTGGGSASLSAMAIPLQVLRHCQHRLRGEGSTLRLSGVTVPDAPADWGEIVGSATVATDGIKVIYDPPAAFTNHGPGALPTFAVQSGPCSVRNGGLCIQSPNFPNMYADDEACTFVISGSGFIQATTFATWPGGSAVGGATILSGDDLTINGTGYSGDGGVLSTTGVPVSDGMTISWRSDQMFGSNGFDVCAIDACGEHGSTGGGTACVCIGGYTGDRCTVPPLQPFPPGFFESYTITGCSVSSSCGLFTRVAARCTSGSGCPGGPNENSGSIDSTLCHGAPVYQRGGDDGPVLYRWMWGDGRTDWYVMDSSVLEDCFGSTQHLHSIVSNEPNGGRLEEGPTALAYNNGANWQGGTGWADSDADAAAAADGRGEDACSHTSCGITVVPGRGR